MTNEITTSQGTIVPKNSNLAIISLISGILGLTFLPLIGSIVAVITGPMAKREIDESAGQLSGREMANVGLILGWIGIGLTVILCCCILLFGVPLWAFFGVLIQDNFYYWLGSGLLGLLF